MAATTTEARLAGVTSFVAEQTEASEATRMMQRNLLSELPGLVFGLLTLFYVVSSLIF